MEWLKRAVLFGFVENLSFVFRSDPMLRTPVLFDATGPRFQCSWNGAVMNSRHHQSYDANLCFRKRVRRA